MVHLELEIVCSTGAIPYAFKQNRDPNIWIACIN